jgi:ribosome maturation factor RimP
MMITTDQLQQALQQQLDGTPRFVVSAAVRPGGKAVVEVDHDDAPITLADLTAINKGLQEAFGEALDDVEMQVGSPGTRQALQSGAPIPQSLGKKVDVSMADGTELQGVLEAFDNDGISLRILQPTKVKGRQPKLSDETTVIPFTGIKAVQATINLN